MRKIKGSARFEQASPFKRIRPKRRSTIELLLRANTSSITCEASPGLYSSNPLTKSVVYDASRQTLVGWRVATCERSELDANLLTVDLATASNT